VTNHNKNKHKQRDERSREITHPTWGEESHARSARVIDITSEQQTTATQTPSQVGHPDDGAYLKVTHTSRLVGTTEDLTK